MTEPLQYTVIDGINCYSPSVAADCTDYPDSGFDVTDKSARNSFWVRSRSRLFKRLVERSLKPMSQTSLLEIGCGTGEFIGHLAGDERLKLTGSEVYLKGLVYAKKNLPHVDFVQFDVTHGTIGAEFDMICAFDVIEHIRDDRTALANMHRMLAPQGVVLLSVPQHMFLWSRLDELVKHKRRYSRRELLAKLEETGFDIRYATSFVFVLFPLLLLSRLFDRGNASPQGTERELARRVTFPKVADAIFDFFMRIDEWLIGSGLSLPFGGTLIAIARKT